MPTVNLVLKHFMRQTFEAMEQAGGFKQTPMVASAGYSAALAEQKAKKNQQE